MLVNMLHKLLEERAAADIKVGLVGAGQMGEGWLPDGCYRMKLAIADVVPGRPRCFVSYSPRSG
jgi:predicted homoserine dehydrogenase-like protein